MVVFEKSIERAARRGGVPVLSRVSVKPRRMSDSLRRSTAGRPSPPDGVDSLPMKIRPRNEVPVVRMMRCAPMNPCCSVTTPMAWAWWISSFEPDCVLTSTTQSSMTVRCCWQAMTRCIRRVYSALSHWARVAWTAGPRLVLSAFSCSEVRSALNPISPPRASSSNTR